MRSVQSTLLMSLAALLYLPVQRRRKIMLVFGYATPAPI